MERIRGGLIGMDAATELSLPWFGHAIVSEGRRRRRGHSAQVDVCTVFYYRSRSYNIFSERARPQLRPNLFKLPNFSRIVGAVNVVTG